MNLLSSKMHGEMERSERGPAFDKMQNKTKQNKIVWKKPISIYNGCQLTQ